MAKIVIIGAGLTGLSTAYHLEKNGFFDYSIYEKEKEIGGLCRSVSQNGFTFDFTGHLLHINDPYFNKLIDDIVGKENLNLIFRRSFVYSNNVFVNYPFQSNLYGLPIEVIVECIEEFVKRPKNKKNTKSFYDWVLKNFGAGIAKHFFEPYQNKILDYDLKKISDEWAGSFVPQTSLKTIIEGALKQAQTSTAGYNSQFYYPQDGGIFYFVKKIADKIINPIHTNFTLEKVDLKNKIIKFSNGHTEKFEQLISTIPLDILINLLDEKSSTIFKRASKNLVCNSVINYNLGIERENLTDKHWIYIPEEKFPFYRMGFPHNFSQNLVPNGCSSIYGEFSFINKTDHTINELLKQSIEQTKGILNISDSEIICEKVIQIQHAYVIYNFWRQKNLPNLLHELKENNIHSIGRYGGWKYSSMQDAILDGLKTANELTYSIRPARKAEKFERIIKTPTKEKEIQG